MKNQQGTDLLKTALQAVLRPLTRYVASGFRLNVQFFTNGGVTPISAAKPRFKVWDRIPPPLPRRSS